MESQLSPYKGHSPQFLVHAYCGQTAGWMKTPHFARRGPRSPRKGHSSPTLFSAHVYCGHVRPFQLLLCSCSRFLSVLAFSNVSVLSFEPCLTYLYLIQSRIVCMRATTRVPVVSAPPRFSRHHLSNNDCLENKTENHQNCCVLCCALELCTMIRAHMWAVLKDMCWFMFKFRFSILCVFFSDLT